MKKLLFILVALFCSSSGFAQNCDKLVVDLKKGTINGLKPTATQAQVKKKLPCFTGDSEDGGEYNCGGGVFFINHDFYCYTGKDYIEIRRKFKGILSIDLLGLDKTAAEKKLGMGRAVRTEINEDGTFLFFKTAYGCIVLTLEDEAVVNIAMHSKPAAKVELCL